MVGSPANLTVPMVVYPPPQKEDYTWVIQDNSTNTKIEVKPGIYISEIKYRGNISEAIGN